MGSEVNCWVLQILDSKVEFLIWFQKLRFFDIKQIVTRICGTQLIVQCTIASTNQNFDHFLKIFFLQMVVIFFLITPIHEKTPEINVSRSVDKFCTKKLALAPPTRKVRASQSLLYIQMYRRR